MEVEVKSYLCAIFIFTFKWNERKNIIKNIWSPDVMLVIERNFIVAERGN